MVIALDVLANRVASETPVRFSEGLVDSLQGSAEVRHQLSMDQAYASTPLGDTNRTMHVSRN